MKTRRKEKGFQLDAEGRELRAHVKELDHREGLPSKSNRGRPRSKAASDSEAGLLKLGGRREVIRVGESRRQTRIVFGGVGETRFIFTPQGAQWKIELDAKPLLEELNEELKWELAKSGRGLLDNDNQKADIAFQAVDALLTCSRDWQNFSALPESEQEKADLYRAMVRVQLAILTTLQALERDAKNEGRKLQVAFELRKLLTDQGWPSQIGKLRDDAVNLVGELQRPPSKKELKDRFDPPLPHYPGGRVRPSEFSRLLKAAGLSWLKRGKRDRGPVNFW